MISLYNVNGLVLLEERDIRIKRFIEDHLKEEIKLLLMSLNHSWKFYQIEAPCLIPKDLISKNYTNNDIWVQENVSGDSDLVLKPETTPSSYVYAKHLLKSNLCNIPFVVYQTSKSFRREQNQPIKNMRLKEFYQQEYQCLYSSDSLNDYQEKVLEPIRYIIEDLLKLPVRIVDSDRLPSYSLKTVDIEVFNDDKWMEVCSISKRNDFTEKAIFNVKNKVIEKDILVLEIAIGIDRLLFNYINR